MQYSVKYRITLLYGNHVNTKKEIMLSNEYYVSNINIFVRTANVDLILRNFFLTIQISKNNEISRDFCFNGRFSLV